MEERLMTGMFWGGVLLSSIPIMLGIGVGIYALRRYLADRAAPDGTDAGPGAPRG